jgi:Domain of unknown function (DUF5666)/Domain of unknown function (DUF4382)
MKRLLAVGVLLALSIIGLGCGASNNSQLSQDKSGNVFLTGEDAPLASVVSFNVTLNSVTLNAQDGSTATVISSPVTVDFARLLGLRSPLAFNSVAANTYTSATFVLANPVISYVDMTQVPPALNQLNGTFPNNQNPYSVTVNFPTAMVVGANGLAGLKMEMDIRQSVAVDSNGQITGAVNPVIYVRATKASDPDGQVTDLLGGLVSVNSGNNSFVLQGPYGHQLTIYVNGSTSFNSGWNINDLATPAFVAVQGYFQADGSVMATGVEVVTTAHSFVSGRVLAQTTNSSGQVQTLTMWIGETGADMVSYADTIQTINVSAVNTYDICFLSGPVLSAVFNDTSVVVGQRIFIGGSFAGNLFTPQMISLRLQGIYGAFVPGSVTVSNGNAGNFALSNNGLVGYSAGGPVTVNTFNFTGFYNLTGLGQLQTTSGTIPVVARGLLLKNQVSGNPEMYAGWVATTPGN